MNSATKGYLYFAIAALLLLIAMPTILNIVLMFIAAAFIISGLALVKDNLPKRH
jgi:membrane protein implicated in regulation of membrane protease activity